MNKFLRFFVLTALMVIPSGLFAQPVSIKVLDWNVLSFEKTDKSGQNAGFIIDDHVSLIREQNPDVVCLNEFETGTSRMGKEKMAEVARALGGMYSYFIMSYPKDDGFYGNVILSKYPIIASSSTLHEYKHALGKGNYQWNSGKDEQDYGADQRSVGYADIAVPSGGSYIVVCIVCSHFDHMGSETVRENQAKKSVEFASLANPVYPTIMCGDLNTNGSALAPLGNAGDHVGVNWVDHMYSFPKGKWTAGDFKSVPSGNLSDHDPIVATLTLK